jgi:hypothetical protein
MALHSLLKVSMVRWRRLESPTKERGGRVRILQYLMLRSCSLSRLPKWSAIWRSAMPARETEDT